MKRHGLTLIELIVAMILTAIIAFITIQMITGEHANYTKTRDKIQLQSDGREAMRIMEEEIKNAGYRYTATGPCIGGNFTSGAYIDVDSQATATVIGVRFYNPMASAITCGTDLKEIDYRWDVAQKTLSRRILSNPTTPGSVDAMDATNYVPFLNGVDTFRVAFGVVQDSVVLLQPSNLASGVALGSLTTAVPLASTWTLAPSTSGFAGTIVDVGTDRKITITFPNTAGTYTVRMGNPLPLTTVVGENALNDSATYRIGFKIESGSAALLDAITGVKGHIRAGFFDNSSVPLGVTGQLDTFSFMPSLANARNIQFDLSPSLLASQRTIPYFFGFQIILGAGSSTRQLVLYNPSITRLNNGRVQSWQHPAGIRGTTTLMHQIGSVEIKLHTLDIHKNLTSFDRFVQVVNNDN